MMAIATGGHWIAILKTRGTNHFWQQLMNLRMLCRLGVRTALLWAAGNDCIETIKTVRLTKAVTANVFCTGSSVEKSCFLQMP